jgi:hypothetical protein
VLRVASILVAGVVLVTLSQRGAPVVPGRLLASLPGRNVPLLTPSAAPVDDSLRQIQGRVRAAEPTAGVIRVSSGFFGLMSIALVVTSDTLIVVGDKEGGFGDIHEGDRVVAAYDPSLLHVRRVEVLADVPPAGAPAAYR